MAFVTWHRIIKAWLAIESKIIWGECMCLFDSKMHIQIIILKGFAILSLIAKTKTVVQYPDSIL